MSTAPEPQDTEFFSQVSTNNYLNDATEVSMWAPKAVLEIAPVSDQLQQGSWIFYKTRVPDPTILSFGTYDFGVNVPTEVNLLPTIVDDPYEAYTQPGRDGDAQGVENIKLLTSQTFGADQLNYTLKNGLARQLVEAFVGEEMLPEAVDLTQFTPAIYSQGLLPNSYSHALAHVININRTTSFLASGQLSSLDDALLVGTGILPSRIHMTALHNRVRYQNFLSPNYNKGDLTQSAATFGFVPVYALANFGVATEAPQVPGAYQNITAGGAFSYPQAANIPDLSLIVLQDRQAYAADLWQKNSIAFDGYVNASSAAITPDLKGLQWRSLSDPSLHTNAKSRVSAKRLRKLIHQHLGRGIPLTIQVNVYDNWRRQMIVDPTNAIIPLPEANADPLGSHFFTIAGYNDSHYTVINSMGQDVGDNGNFLLSKDYVDNEQDCMSGTGTYLLTSPCWNSHSVGISACAPKSHGCNTNQSTYFNWRSLFS